MLSTFAIIGQALFGCRLGDPYGDLHWYEIE